jgi:hypothetical protein
MTNILRGQDSDLGIDRRAWKGFRKNQAGVIGTASASSIDQARVELYRREIRDYYYATLSELLLQVHPGLLHNMDESGFPRKFEKDRPRRVVFTKDCQVASG